MSLASAFGELDQCMVPIFKFIADDRPFYERKAIRHEFEAAAAAAQKLAIEMVKLNRDHSQIIELARDLEQVDPQHARQLWNHIKAFLSPIVQAEMSQAPAAQTDKPKATRKGRQVNTDFESDRRIADGWESGNWSRYADYARELREPVEKIRAALDRDRKRRTK